MRVFEVVFTKQKRQKRKRWTDGYLTVSEERRKLKLYAAPDDDSGAEVAVRGRVLDELFVNDTNTIEEDIEFENYLVERGAPVDLAALSTQPPPQQQQQQQQEQQRTNPTPSLRAPRPRPDLFSGSLARPRPAQRPRPRAHAALLHSEEQRGANACDDNIALAVTNQPRDIAKPLPCLRTSSDLMELMGFETPSSKNNDLNNLENHPPPNKPKTPSSHPCTRPFTRPSSLQNERISAPRAATPSPCSGGGAAPKTEATTFTRLRPVASAFKRPRVCATSTTSETLSVSTSRIASTSSNASLLHKPKPATHEKFTQPNMAVPKSVEAMLPAQTLHLALRFRQQGPWDLSRNCVHAFPADDAGSEYLKVFQQRSANIVCEEMQASLDSFADFLTRGGSRKRLQERYDDNCTLFRTMPRPRASDTSRRKMGKSKGKHRRYGRKSNVGGSEDDEDVDDQDLEDEEEQAGEREEQEEKVKQPRIFLSSKRLKDNRAARKACRFGDLWLVSRKPFLEQAATDYKRIWVLQSIWHGPSVEGVLEVVPVSSNFDPRQVSARWQQKTRVSVLHGPNLEHELAMARLLENLNETSLPLFPSLALPRARESFCGLLAGNVRAEVMANNAMHEVAAQFKLNQDQQAVLCRTKAWLLDEKTDPVILVHGAYGAGKTQLSVAAIVFLTRVLDTIGDQTVRICVAAATNVAVDNVLKGLKRHGFDAFNRVGSIRNMDQELLEHALHYSERGLAAAVQDARAQLTDLARDTLRTTRSAGPSQALRYLEKTPLTKLAKEQQRREMQCRVVGVTCCSSSREFMMQTFQKPGVRTICLIDEAAQAVEALSMLPLVRTRAQVAMLVGDPLQLPPLTATQAIPQCAQKSSSSTMPSSRTAPKRYADGATSMFDRLRRLGREPVRLSVQYRCHPRISEISSKLFYDGKVRSGVCEADRPALLAGLPAVGFYDVGAVNEKRTTDGSFVNEREQSLVCMMISKLIEAGVRPEQIGAIALYRAQAEAIESRLQAGGRANGVAVSTVDAFQGAERDVILISTCRTSGPGFTACPRRVNVMITRARHHLVILGRRDALCVSRLWRDVLQQCDTQTSLEGVLQHLDDAALEAREHNFDEDLELERELHGD